MRISKIILLVLIFATEKFANQLHIKIENPMICAETCQLQDSINSQMISGFKKYINESINLAFDDQAVIVQSESNDSLCSEFDLKPAFDLADKNKFRLQIVPVIRCINTQKFGINVATGKVGLLYNPFSGDDFNFLINIVNTDKEKIIKTINVYSSEIKRAYDGDEINGSGNFISHLKKMRKKLEKK
jgi:hypothetical protein